MAEFFSGTTFIGDALNVLLYLSGGLFVFYGQISVGDFAAFLLYISVFMNPIRRLVGFIEQYQNGMTGFRRFLEIMDYPIEADDPGAKEIGRVKGEIEFNNVTFRYEEEKTVLLYVNNVLYSGFRDIS
jgi:ATP-binding cassette subfamily B protein